MVLSLTTRSKLSKISLFGIAVLITGLSLSFAIIILALAGVTGPIPILTGVFYAGIFMNFIGFGILLASLAEARRRKQTIVS